MNSTITDMNQSWSMEMEQKEEGLSAKWFFIVLAAGLFLHGLIVAGFFALAGDV